MPIQQKSCEWFDTAAAASNSFLKLNLNFINETFLNSASYEKFSSFQRFYTMLTIVITKIQIIDCSVLSGTLLHTIPNQCLSANNWSNHPNNHHHHHHHVMTISIAMVTMMSISRDGRAKKQRSMSYSKQLEQELPPSLAINNNGYCNGHRFNCILLQDSCICTHIHICILTHILSYLQKLPPSLPLQEPKLWDGAPRHVGRVEPGGGCGRKQPGEAARSWAHGSINNSDNNNQQAK